VFGMGTGGTPPVWPPGTFYIAFSCRRSAFSFGTSEPDGFQLITMCKTMSIRSKAMMLNRTTD
jgi:hypothetical protein